MTMIQHRDTGDESEAAMTDERAAVELEKKFPWIVAGFHMNPRSPVAVLKRYDDEGNLLEERDVDVPALEDRVSELTRLLAEAEERAENFWRFADHKDTCALMHNGFSGFSYGDECSCGWASITSAELERRNPGWKERYEERRAERSAEIRRLAAEKRALQSGEGKEPSR